MRTNLFSGIDCGHRSWLPAVLAVAAAVIPSGDAGGRSCPEKISLKNGTMASLSIPSAKWVLTPFRTVAVTCRAASWMGSRKEYSPVPAMIARVIPARSRMIRDRNRFLL